MEQLNWVIPTTSIFIILFLILKRRSDHKKLPPSPPALPAIGHLHLLKQPLHRSLHKLTQKYGHVLILRFGIRKVLVVSSPSAVEECFTKNDIIFANRPRTLAGKHLGYNQRTIGSSLYGDHWRNLRRLATLELFSTKSLAKFQEIREDEVKLLAKQLFEECRGQVSEVNLRLKLVELAFNTMLRVISGKRYYGKDVVVQEAKNFQILMKEFAELLGSGNINDFFPLLQWFDFGGVEKRMVKLMSNMDSFLQNLLNEHRSVRASNRRDTEMTLIDIMLSLQEKDREFYTDQNIQGLILTLLVAGSETSATAMEWALSLLLNHPEAMDKARFEIDCNVGQERLVSESDISKLNYLQNVISETLRLFPVVPLMLPHESSHDCTVGGFRVPRGTMLLVNLWSMHRDSNLWEDPTRFVPERFESRRESGEGATYKLIPFGAGRRACPGAGLAKRTMGQALGVLIQSFEWHRIGHEKINMAEGRGATIPKLDPLIALCNPRQGMIELLTHL
ncbi:hypothetical protein L6164_015482 [Bauhinia variegata]|uniref:Uncharacterized protein n=1 Tax=Bauhinia variegata TaxID=167791 RepID=A0ACB9NLH5_BAUVA|nr:hypothetical protein L6164_015482 [Bauhinia variegata]